MATKTEISSPAPPAFETLLFETPADAIAVARLNRPQRLNAITWQLVDELHALCDHLEHPHSPYRVLILTGAGGNFSSGTDLKDTAEGNRFGKSVPSDLRLQRRIADLALDFRRIPQPIIAVNPGVAAGGGLSFSLAADVRLAAPNARYIASYINIGLSACEIGSSYFLPRLVGLSRAAEILYTGRTVSGEEAERIGLVSRCHPADELEAAALELAQTMAAKSPFGLRMTKEVLNQSVDAPSLESALYLENRTQVLGTRTEDFHEAVQAFVKKRPADFKGK